MTPISIFSAAKNFMQAYRECYGNGFRTGSGGPSLVVPAIVCVAFANELALKALIVATGGNPRGHCLKKLFLALPKDIRLEIIQNSALSCRDFYRHIAAVSNSFIEWRYIFEKNGFHTVDRGFLELLYSAIEPVGRRFARLHRSLLLESTRAGNQSLGSM